MAFMLQDETAGAHVTCVLSLQSIFEAYHYALSTAGVDQITPAMSLAL